MGNKKWLTIIAMVTCSLLMSSSLVLAAETVKSDMLLQINGKHATFASQSLLVNSSLYAPYEAAAKQLGADANWNADTKTLKLQKESNSLEMKEGAMSYKVNGLELTAATSLQVIDGAVFVPVRVVFEAFDYQIKYESKTRSVSMQ
jgi:hypothetical protein